MVLTFLHRDRKIKESLLHPFAGRYPTSSTHPTSIASVHAVRIWPATTCGGEPTSQRCVISRQDPPIHRPRRNGMFGWQEQDLNPVLNRIARDSRASSHCATMLPSSA